MSRSRSLYCHSNTGPISVTVPLLPFEYGTNGVNGPNFKGENKV
jgi:hypothetical protein